MKRVFDHIRYHLERQAGLTPNDPAKILGGLYESEWSTRFESLMRNRLVQGALRYGPLHAAGKKRWDRVSGIRKRLEQYEATGNLEYLVDSANLALIEFEEGNHPRRHWAPATDGDHACA